MQQNNRNFLNKTNKSTVSDDDRAKIISKTLGGSSPKDISTMLQINYKTVWRIVNMFNKHNVSTSRPRGGDRKSKLSNQQKLEILGWIDENCLLRLKDICQLISEKFGFTVGKSTVERIVKGFHYNLKSTVSIPERRNCDSTLESRFNYARDFRNLELETEDKNLVFLDEVGFAVVTRPKRGRAARGASPFLSVSAARSRNISVVAAMNKYGMVYHKIHDKAVNGENFRDCLVELKDACSKKILIIRFLY